MQILYRVHRLPRWLIWLLAIPVLMLADVFGVIVMAVVLGLVLIAAVVLGVQLWRTKRRLRRMQTGQVLDGEYIKVQDTRRDRFP